MKTIKIADYCRLGLLVITVVSYIGVLSLHMIL